MSNIRVSLVGLPWDHPNVPAHLQQHVRDTVAALGPEMEEAGFKYGFIPVTPEEDMAGIGEKVRSSSPDVIVFGNGIRANMDLTPFMEQLIETVRTSAPQAKLAFNTFPENTVEAAKRMCPSITPA